ncbi:hypothetical protein CEXT_624961 [Caerostris extrusa]|uniref:Uncharacterized protein n=1 Tax=Caerostris extrusa TaxID=172846 RepID=A0AAV4RVJ1_CAEEX|nr:hypothetical protein CEXT_624961 [Caerostris extrusa]
MQNPFLHWLPKKKHIRSSLMTLSWDILRSLVKRILRFPTSTSTHCAWQRLPCYRNLCALRTRGIYQRGWTFDKVRVTSSAVDISEQ